MFVNYLILFNLLKYHNIENSIASIYLLTLFNYGFIPSFGILISVGLIYIKLNEQLYNVLSRIVKIMIPFNFTKINNFLNCLNPPLIEGIEKVINKYFTKKEIKHEENINDYIDKTSVLNEANKLLNETYNQDDDNISLGKVKKLVEDVGKISNMVNVVSKRRVKNK